MESRISFIIPVFGKLELTQNCVESLKSSLSISNYEIIIVDDGSDPETANGLDRLSDEKTFIIHKAENGGFATAINAGALRAKAATLIFINNDLVFPKPWLDPLLKVFKSHPKAGAVGNVQISTETNEIDHCGFEVYANGRFAHRKTLSKRAVSESPFATGACFAVQRSTFIQLGGFDETFVNGCEDIDFCLRLKDRGLKTYIANRSIVRHHVGSTRGRESDRNEERNYRTLQRRWKDSIRDFAARSWARETLKTFRSQPRQIEWAQLWEAVKYNFGKRSAPPTGLKLANAYLAQNERHWRSLIDGVDDESIKDEETNSFSNSLTDSFSFQKLYPSSESYEGVWIKEAGELEIAKGITVGKISIKGFLHDGSESDSTAKGKIGLLVQANGIESKLFYPIPTGAFSIDWEKPPLLASEHSTIRLQLIGVNRTNAFAYLGRIISKWFFLPKALREKLGKYRAQRKNQRLRIYSLLINDETVLDFKKNPTSPLNFDYIRKRSNIGVNLVGWFKAELGIGESARLAAKALQASSIKHSLVPLKVNCLAAQGDSSLDHLFSKNNPHPINIVHIDAPQSPDIDHYHGDKFRKDKYNIGYWAWELPEFPDEWVKYFRYFDEIWTPSNFVRDAISMKSPVPVLTVPHCVEFSLKPADYRKALGLPSDKFLFCFAYDLNSYQERKNPKAVIRAFKEAFSGSPDQDQVGLVIKTHSIKNNPAAFAELKDQLEGVENFYLIDKTLSREMVYGLMSACDAYVSLHRSEGFGLTVAESMLLGRPVISTNWSATTEFLNADNGCPVRSSLIEIKKTHGPYQKGQIWANPDPSHAAEYMQRLFADSELCKNLGAKANGTIAGLFSAKRIGSIYQNRIKAFSQWH